MPRLSVLHLMLTLGLSLPLAACGGTSPDKLATSMQSALRAGDQDAALALARLDDAPALVHGLYLHQVVDCTAAGTTCNVSVAPLDEDYAQQLEGMAAEGLEAGTAAAGLIVIESENGKRSGTLRLPYAMVDSDYRIVSQRYSAARLEELRGRSNAALLQQMLERGIYDPQTGARDRNWQDGATGLPAGGGEVGAAFRKRVEALAAAVAAGDPDAAVANGDTLAAMALAAEDFSGNPVPIEARRRKLRAEAARMLQSVEIEGGWQKGDEAILVFTGRNGIGWTRRGAIHLKRSDSGWESASETTVEHPGA